MDNWVDDIQAVIGSVSDVIQEGADVYDKMSGRPDVATPSLVTEPAQTTGVDTTQGTTADGWGVRLRMSPLILIVLLVVLLAIVGRA